MPGGLSPFLAPRPARSLIDDVVANDVLGPVLVDVLAVDAAVEIGLGGVQQVRGVMQSQTSKHAGILPQARSDLADLVEITCGHDCPSPCCACNYGGGKPAGRVNCFTPVNNA